jgi:hypothetical protein
MQTTEGANSDKIYKNGDIVLCSHKGHYYTARVGFLLVLFFHTFTTDH